MKSAFAAFDSVARVTFPYTMARYAARRREPSAASASPAALPSATEASDSEMRNCGEFD